MATTPKQRPQSAYQLSRPILPPNRSSNSDDHDGDSELRRQLELRNKLSYSAKSSFDWLWQKSGILGNWMNKQAGKMGMEAFWPTSLDKECEKCARILYTFTQRGGTIHSTLEDPHADRKTQRVIKKIPPQIIQQAEGLAIFTVFRTGLGWSAASGSGVVISRDSPTTWGAPSGILIHTIGLGFLAGIDVYDAVLVLRTQKAVMSFAKPKVSLGAELAIVAGPVGNGVSFESGPEISPVFSYIKSKGIYGGLQLDGNIIVERSDENARFYGRKVKAEQILQGGAVAVPRAASGLIAVIDAAEGKLFDPEDFPEQIDLAPSEESAGVSTIRDSRSKAAMECGIPEESEEETVVPSPPLHSVSHDLPNRRRTLPPMPFHSVASTSSNPTSNTKGDDVIPEPSEQEPIIEGLENDGELTEPLEEPTRPIVAPPPPPPPRRRVPLPPPVVAHPPPPPVTTEVPNDTLSSSTATFSDLQDSLVDTSSDTASEQESVSLADADGLISDHDKPPPEPFKLHERSGSNTSMSSPPQHSDISIPPSNLQSEYQI